jgi:hypothetical protein
MEKPVCDKYQRPDHGYNEGACTDSASVSQTDRRKREAENERKQGKRPGRHEKAQEPAGKIGMRLNVQGSRA